MLNNVFKKSQAPKSNNKENPMSPRTRLEGYHEIIKEIIEKGYAADVRGESVKAQQLYNKSLQIIDEALSLNVKSTGLSSKADTVSMWKRDLNDWKIHVSERLADFDPSSTSSKIVMNQRPKTQTVIRKNTNLRTKKPEVKSKKANTSENNRFKDIIMGEILVSTSNIKWSDVSGLETAKQALYESVVLPVLRPELFQGLRSPPKGILLYGPPGNGKTFIAKALANEAQATFFNISASSLTSKWVGEGEKLVRSLFEVASEHEPSIIFIDEIDSILTERTSEESGALRRLKTEFLLQFDGIGSSQGNVIVIGATNRPHDLDDAARRRLVKRIYVPLPSHQTRSTLISNLISNQKNVLSSKDVKSLASITEGYSASDLTALFKEAALSVLREMGDKVLSINPNAIRALKKGDVISAMNTIKPSVNIKMLESYQDFTDKYGTQ